MKHLSSCTIVAGIVMILCSAVQADQRPERVVLMGDSITDGHTVILLLQESLQAAGRTGPIFTNAGISGDMGRDMRKRVERDILPHRPTLVTLSVGINDVVRGVTNADYEADVRAIVQQLKAAGIPLMILTTTVLGPQQAAADKRLVEYNGILRRIAQEFGARVAEVNQNMEAARREGQKLLENDDVHLSQAGYRVMARSVLDGLGYTDVPVVEETHPRLIPGIIDHWQMRVAPDDKPLDSAAVAALKPDDTWRKYTLPETEPRDHWWEEQERHRGFAQSLAKLIGPGKLHQGVATLESPQARDVYFNTGGLLKSVWLNGQQVFKSEGWTGWHVGKERIKVQLKPGPNRVVIEAAGSFLLTVSDNNTW